ncbi:MAG: hypothetical protein HY355_06060 [Armatimonadetes bacterium]|nr:hypothetical protein [Armatimonadota bacterium]
MRIVLLEGDQTGQELLLEAIRVLDPDLLGIPITFERFDLSLRIAPLAFAAPIGSGDFARAL